MQKTIFEKLYLQKLYIAVPQLYFKMTFLCPVGLPLGMKRG